MHIHQSATKERKGLVIELLKLFSKFTNTCVRELASLAGKIISLVECALYKKDKKGIYQDYAMENDLEGIVPQNLYNFLAWTVGASDDEACSVCFSTFGHTLEESRNCTRHHIPPMNLALLLLGFFN